MKCRTAIGLAALVAVLVASADCASAQVAQTEKQPRSYLKLPPDAYGNRSPLLRIWERAARGKHIVVIGTTHTRDPRSPMYDRIEAIFQRVHPQLVLHEDTAPDFLKKMSRDQAIRIGAEIGFSVYLAGRYGATIQSGDASEKEEFSTLLADYPAENVLVFLTGQRLLGDRHPDLKELGRQYPAFFESYLVANGIPRRSGWETWDGFLRAYERVVGHPLTRESWDPDLVSPIRRTGILSEMCRTADAFRDRHLFAAIRVGLKDHDRVVVVFGQWHVLALEPVLDGVLEN